MAKNNLNDMKKYKLLTNCFILCGMTLLSVVPLTLAAQPTQSDYNELPNPRKTDISQWQKSSKTTIGWGSIDIRYKKEAPAEVASSKKILVNAWKGERVSAQFVVSTKVPLENLSYAISNFKNAKTGTSISPERMSTGFVRYVMTDELNKDGKGGCGYRYDHSKFDSTLVADVIDPLTKTLAIPAYTTQSAWIRVWVPANAEEGYYDATIAIKNGTRTLSTLKMTVKVGHRVLPQPKDWSFHLDLWQNPFAIARYYGLKLWSKEHFDTMKPYMEMYRDAGGKVITTSIIHKPWNGQTYDYYDSMIGWTRLLDGSWSFDYTVFDKWVSFMMNLGINKEIGCYSMVPWKLSFSYYDQATHEIKEMKTKPGEAAYEEMWMAFLRSFATHLKEKGWFDITYIAMDERPAEIMKTTLSLIRRADKNFKVSMAGGLHKELFYELDDYCVSLTDTFPEEVKQKRRQEGKTTTYYTSCSEPFPNTFTFSPPAESEWLGWHAAKENLNGYLRWSLCHWNKSPLQDSRFTAWAAGDTYIIYPGPRPSIRWERFIDGIQAFEKIKVLRKTATPAQLQQIDKALSLFNELDLYKKPASFFVNQAREILQGIE